MLDSKNLNSTNTFVEFTPGHKHMTFNQKTNTLATWGLNSKDVVFYSIDENKLVFEKKSRIAINELGRRRGNTVNQVLLTSSGESAFVFVSNSLYKLNLSSNTYYKFLQLPYSLIAKSFVIQNDFIIVKSYISRRIDAVSTYGHYLDVIDLVSGKFSSLEIPNLRHAALLPTPIENTVLVGKGLGVQLLKIEKDNLEFKSSEELSQSINVNKQAEKISNERKVLFDKSVTLVGKGKSGVDQALRLGLIRPAADKDLKKWKSKNKDHPKILSRVRNFNRYVILKPVKFSGGLAGANSVVFISNNSKYGPFGSIGHSIVLLNDTGACQGFLCSNL